MKTEDSQPWQGAHNSSSSCDEAQQRGSKVSIEAQLLNVAYQSLPLALLMTIVVVVIFGTQMRPYFPPEQSVIWAAALVGTTALRFVLWMVFKRAAPTR